MASPSHPKYIITKIKHYNIMISKRLEDAINAQINAELWSAYLYLSMSAYCQDKGFAGYLISRGGRVLLKAIDAVETEWASPLAAFEHTYKHEQHVTSLINNLMQIAVDEKDFAAQSRLQWFIDEQVEEEENAVDIINKLKLLDGNSYGLYVLDQELAARVYATPSPLAPKA